MYIEFMATLEDVVDINYRFWQRGKRKSWDWIYVVLTSGGVASLVLLLLTLLRPKDWPSIFVPMLPLLLTVFFLVAASFLGWGRVSPSDFSEKVAFLGSSPFELVF